MLALASTLFIICPGVALLASDMGPPWRAVGTGLLVAGVGSCLYWTVRNYRDWKRELAPTRRRGKLHKDGL